MPDHTSVHINDALFYLLNLILKQAGPKVQEIMERFNKPEARASIPNPL